MRKCLIIIVIGLFSCLNAGASLDDILIADFEGETYGDWQVTGEALGPVPAQGTLPNQMPVSGFEGKGLVNTYYKGDGTIGTLTSPPFKIERKYINFLIGGGKYPGETCINLLVNVKVLCTATGPNDRPGGSEELDWYCWDVSESQGQIAQIQIVDQRTEGWGHINVDQIYQSNRKHEVITGTSREFLLQNKYLNFPVKNDARKHLVSLLMDDEVVREFEVALASDEPDFWVFLDTREFKGEKAILHIDRYDPLKSKGFDAIYQADTFVGEENLYQEKLRPQFHFTSRRGWNNDTNGMVYYKGEYHLFYQHNPYGWQWGNMTWGHAISKDMVHWTELGDAIHPDCLGTIFSGSAIVDENNTAGFQTNDEKVIVCIYTSAGGTNPISKGQPFTQSIAYSNDRGRTWQKYGRNPVLGHIKGENRDPKVFWHNLTGQWVMVLYLDDGTMGLLTSRNLKSWEFQSKLECFHECPELFTLPVDGNENNQKWILYGGSGDYLIGDFDGREFKSEAGPIRYNYGDCFYASQTFNNIPHEDGRRIQMAWGRVNMPEMPFNQMILFPVTLTLRTTEEGVRMFSKPIREIETIHRKNYVWKNTIVRPGENPLRELSGELFHIAVELRPVNTQETGLVIRGVPIIYNVEKQELSCREKKAPLKSMNGRIDLELLVDRTSVEIFGNQGRIYMPIGVILSDKERPLEIFSRGGNTEITNMQIYELRSIWE